MELIFSIGALVFALAAAVLAAYAAYAARQDARRTRQALEQTREAVITADRSEAAALRQELGAAQIQHSEGIQSSLHALRNVLDERLMQNARDANAQLVSLQETSERRLSNMQRESGERFEQIRATLEERLEKMRAENAQKLEQMRQTVDEKLQGTLETRLGQAFQRVGQQLESVYKGLGEMRQIATDVGDLKRVMSNVKVRGSMGEIQLEALLEQILAPDQYVANYRPFARSSKVVEFAIRMPNRDEAQGYVHLPLDAKFPQEDYLRMLEAWDANDRVALDSAREQLRRRLLDCAKDVSEYINPPETTDFAVMFLCSEGMYAEALRMPGLFERMSEMKVIPCGPTTLAALLNSLQMGFRTLAVQRRTNEIAKLLSTVKKSFDGFGDMLARTRKQIDTVGNTIDTALSRTRSIQSRLRNVQALPASDDVIEELDQEPIIDLLTEGTEEQ